MCVFCEIVKGNIPCSKVYEDEKVICFLDLSQATKGHTLVVPKKHVQNIFELEDSDAEAVIKAAKKVAEMQKKNLNALGVNLLNNNNEVASQSVMHYHMHVIPRYEKDEVTIKFTEHEPDFGKLAETLEQLTK